MLNLPQAINKNSVGNVVFRNTYITAVIKEVQVNGKYKVEIASSGKQFPNVFPNDPNITYAVDDTVGILWEYGCREKPIIVGKLRVITGIETTKGVNSLGG